MRPFLICLKAEVLKSRNSMAVWLSLVGTAANLLIFLGLHLLGGQVAGGFAASDWRQYIINHYDGIAFMMLPLYVIILCSLVFLMENRSAMWVQLRALPISPRQVYLGKLGFLLLLFLAAHLLFIIGMVLTGFLYGFLRPETELMGSLPPPGLIAELAARTFLSILGLMGLHAWLSLRFRAFIVPLLIGILGYVVAGLLGTDWQWQFLNPYAPGFLFMPLFKGEALAGHLGWFSPAEAMSIAYLGIFTAFAFRDMEQKG